MNIIKKCEDTKDAVEFFLPQGLYLKPIARLNISVQLPQMKFSGKTISNSELMEKLKSMIFPEEFIILKVVKSTLEFIRFEGEIENKSCLQNVIGRLDTRTLKLANFSEPLKVRAAEAKVAFPTRHHWDAYFRDAKNMNETKPGERPDTIYISNLPYKWFTTKKDIVKGIIRPSEYVLQKAFEVFGEVRCVDIPAADPYRNKMKSQNTGINTFSFDQARTFEAFIQYKEYICFVKAMDSLRGMKLLYREGDRAYTANIKVDFDRTKHLSDASIQRRHTEREKLIAEQLTERERILSQDKQQENSLERQKKNRKHDKKRRHKKAVTDLQKTKAVRKLKTDDGAEKQKLLTQRKLGSLHLLNTLFEMIKLRRRKEQEQQQKLLKLESVKEQERKRKKTKKRKKHVGDDQRSQEERSEKIERELRKRLIKKYKLLQKLQVKEEETKCAAQVTSEQNDSPYNLSSNSKQISDDSSPHTNNSGSPVCHKKTHKKKHKRHKHKSKSRHRKFHRQMGYQPYFERVGNYIYTGCNNYFYHGPAFQCVPGSYVGHDFFAPHWNPAFHGQHFSPQKQFSHYDDISDECYRYFKKVSKSRSNFDEDISDSSTSSNSHSKKRKRSRSQGECPCVLEDRNNAGNHKHLSSIPSDLSFTVTEKHGVRDCKIQKCHKDLEVQRRHKKRSMR